MPRIRVIQNNFTTGEISPRLSARVDFAKYNNGVETLENFIILPHGGITMRPGTRYVNEVKDSSKATRLVRFEFNVEQAYILEFGNHYVRFYTQNGRLENPPGTPVEIRTPYETVDLFDLHFAQSADTLYIAHGEYQPRQIQRVSATEFQISIIDFEDGPYEEEKLKDTPGVPNILPSAATGDITLTADAARFDFSNGSLGTDPFATVNGSKVVTVTHTAHGFKSGMWVEFTGSTIVNGIPAAEINIWHVVYVIDANSYEIVVATTPATSTGSDGGGSVTWVHSLMYNRLIRLKPSAVYSWVKIIDVTSTTIATATVMGDDLDGSGTNVAAYRMGKFDHVIHGYPRTVSFFEERLYWAGNSAYPQTFWGSVEGDFLNHRPGANDADAIDFTIGSNTVNVIRWIMGGSALLIGTAGGEFVVRGGSDGPVTPTSILVKKDTAHGSNNVRPVLASSSVLFVQRSGRKLREMKFSFDEDSFVAQDLSILSEHITSPGIVDMSFQAEPDSIVWMVRSDGVLLGMTYLPEHEVFGWERHTTGTTGAPGLFESVATIPHPNGDRDQTWVLVRRTINGVTKRYVEFFDTVGGFYDNLGTDSGLIYSGAPITVVVGLDHLEGEIVSVTADGATHGALTVGSGQVTLTQAASDIEIGLGFAAKIIPLRPEVQLNTTIQSLALASSTLSLRLFESADVEINGSITHLREVTDLMDTAVPIFTGDLDHEMLGIDRAAQFTLRQPWQLPCTILAMIRTLEIGDN